MRIAGTIASPIDLGPPASRAATRTAAPGGASSDPVRTPDIAGTLDADAAARAARIAAVRAELLAGRYTVDLGGLAERIVGDELARHGV